MAVNKLVVAGEVKFDLTGDTITAADLKKDVIAHDRTGAQITGTCTHDADTSDATALPGEILSGQVAYVKSNRIEGTMPNNGGISETISTKDETVTVPAGFHDGSGTVKISPAAKATIVPDNIKGGITILGVVGTYTAKEVTPQPNKTVTGSFVKQEVTPDEGYDYLSKVTVNPVPYAETPTAGVGGTTITIG